jgi:hypothetical protein
MKVSRSTMSISTEMMVLIVKYRTQLPSGIYARASAASTSLICCLAAVELYWELGGTGQILATSEFRCRYTQLTMISKSTVDLIPFNLTAEWGFHESKRISLPGAHGEDIVRTIHVDNNVSVCGSDLKADHSSSAQAATVFTGGEDGKVKAWAVTTEPEEPNQIGPTRHKKRRGSHLDGIHHKPY